MLGRRGSKGVGILGSTYLPNLTYIILKSHVYVEEQSSIKQVGNHVHYQRYNVEPGPKVPSRFHHISNA